MSTEPDTSFFPISDDAAASPAILPAVKREFEGVKSVDCDPGVFVGLTYDKIEISTYIDKVRDPKTGALVLFIGTTRDNFEGKAVQTLEYTTYPALALRSLSSIAQGLMAEYSGRLHKISIVHRLGIVGVGEDSVVIALSTAHRKEGWEAGEKCLEEVKNKVEIWKREWFVNGGIWRANRDGKPGVEEKTGRVTSESPELREQEDR